MSGRLVHYDLTVSDADKVRDFYAAVVGWHPEPLDMGGYADYVMREPGTGQPVAGVCHARGGNATLPPVWLAYVTVSDFAAAVDRCSEHGGAVVAGPFGEAPGRYTVIRDPAGAMLTLIESQEEHAAPPSPATGTATEPPTTPLAATIVGLDLTVPEAEQIRDFYAAVVGWHSRPVEMGGYTNFEMTHPTTGAKIAGICHAQGANADLPPVWLPYVAVVSLEQALDCCREHGGAVVAGPTGDTASWRYAVIQDPAGAYLALSEGM